MKWRLKNRVTVGGLLALIAASALVIDALRPPAPPDEGEAIRLAKSFLAAHNEFDYADGYWVRTKWNQESGTWRVGFQPPAGRHGYNLFVDVSRDRSCRAAPMDWSF